MAWTKEVVGTTEGFDEQSGGAAENWVEANVYEFHDDAFDKLNKYQFDEANYNMLGSTDLWSEN